MEISSFKPTWQIAKMMPSFLQFFPTPQKKTLVVVVGDFDHHRLAMASLWLASKAGRVDIGLLWIISS